MNTYKHSLLLLPSSAAFKVNLGLTQLWLHLSVYSVNPCVCACVYMYVATIISVYRVSPGCIYVYTHIHTHTHTHTHTHAHTHMHTCIYGNTYKPRLCCLFLLRLLQRVLGFTRRRRRRKRGSALICVCVCVYIYMYICM